MHIANKYIFQRTSVQRTFRETFLMAIRGVKIKHVQQNEIKYYTTNSYFNEAVTGTNYYFYFYYCS